MNHGHPNQGLCDAIATMVAESDYRNCIPPIFGADGQAFLKLLKINYATPAECAIDIVTNWVDLK